ncbi:hypothetical protein DYB32_001539 [Aphanomyces invadans]|uniref:Uncharacterized protein n=1 Tax=Aphanomyces invadans TaxID=157072 RepID=A0A3R6VRW3_9STRA|nr:hypothetical protein DYB32_001539 [Aphanomyces invadans]
MPALLVAVELGHDKITKALLQAGVHAEALDRERNSSLMKALAFGHSSIVDALMASGADVNALNGRDQSVLKFCIVSSSQIQSQAVEAAMATLRSADSSDVVATPRTQQRNVLDASMVLDNIKADTNGLGYLQRLLETGSDPSISDDDGSFPLHWALSSAHIRTTVRGCRVCLRFESTQVAPDAILNLTSLLLQYHAHVNVCNKRGQTPLHIAILNGHAQAALLLLQHGAHPFMTDGLGCLPLHYLCAGACGAATIQVLDAILALAPKFAVMPTVYSDLRKGKTAAEKTLVELDAILDAGLGSLVAPPALTTAPSLIAELFVHPSNSGLFPFHYACGAREPELDMAFDSNAGTAVTRVDVLHHLVTKYGLNIATLTSYRFNAMHFAAKNDFDGSNGAVIGFLLESQVPLNAVHEPKEVDVPKILKPHSTVMFTPRESKEPPMQAYISSYCHLHEYHLVTASGRHVSHVPRRDLVPPKDILALSGEFALSPLHYAVQHSDNATWQLLHAGADLAPDGSDVPLLSLACAAQRGVDVIEYLAPRLAPRQANIRVELTPTMHGTALHFAVGHGNVAVAKVLLDADDTTLKVKRSRDGYTPLHVACALGLKEMVVFLASKGALSTVALCQDSPLHILLDAQRLDILESLAKAQYLAEFQLAWLGEHANLDNLSVPDWLRPYTPTAVIQASVAYMDVTTEINQGQDLLEKGQDDESPVVEDERVESMVVQPEIVVG